MYAPAVSLGDHEQLPRGLHARETKGKLGGETFAAGGAVSHAMKSPLRICSSTGIGGEVRGLRHLGVERALAEAGDMPCRGGHDLPSNEEQDIAEGDVQAEHDQEREADHLQSPDEP